jgi:putative ABC transport system permease protein
MTSDSPDSRDRGTAPSESTWPRLVRVRGLVQLGISRALGPSGQGNSRQTTLAIAGVAIAVAATLIVISIAFALVSGPAVTGTEASYRIVPGDSASSSVMDVQGQRLGRVHPTITRIERFDGISHATPVLFTLARLQVVTDTKPASTDSPYVLVVGVIPASDGQRGTVAGLPTTGLDAGDPHYANGSYNGTWTGEAVLSAGAATVSGATRGDTLRFTSGTDTHPEFSVARVSDPVAASVGQFPVVLVHLSELQQVAGATTGDTADQILVRGDRSEGLKQRLGTIYSGSEVLTEGGLLRQRALASQLPVAISTAALIIGVVIGTLVVAATLGFELLADTTERTIMAAVGVSRRSRLFMIAVHAITVTTVGGLAGSVIWLGGVGLINLVSTRLLDTGLIARLHPLIPLAGLSTTIVIGLLSVPYLLAMSLRAKTTVTENLRGRA